MNRFEERAALCKNSIGRRLFKLMARKQTNLAIAADVTSASDLLNLAKTLGPEIAVLKTHIDIVNDFTPDLPRRLRDLADAHDFLIFEDRKFADIGNTVKHQFRDGIYRIASWADMINAHTLPGPGIIEGLREASDGQGLLLLGQMSSKGSLFTPEYTAATVAMANAYPDFVFGFISQEKISDNPAHIHMTPGVSLASKGDLLGQQYNTPEAVLGERGSDVIIVGRAVIQAGDPCSEAKRFREAAMQAFDQKSLLL